MLRGTKYGVSAAAYPKLAIEALSRSDAQAIYRRDYWDRVHGDELPPPFALLVLDAAVNNGPERAVRWVQLAVSSKVDGRFGPETRDAIQQLASRRGIVALCAEFQARRLAFMASLNTWESFGLGWSRRLCLLLFQCQSMGV